MNFACTYTFNISSCMKKKEELARCKMEERANNFVLLNIDFKDKHITQKNVVQRLTLSDRVAGYGGTIGMALD